MKRTIRKWIIRITATGLLIGGLLIGLVLNPTLLYANKTVIENYTVYHDSVVDSNFVNQLKSVTMLLKGSELYDSTFKLDICLNDGSIYPTLTERVRGQAFAWGFYNKVVLQGNVNYQDNYVELNGYRWSLEQLITHEAIHCYQFRKIEFTCH